MNDFNQSIARGRTMDASIDQGLRTFMLGVYQKLTLGIALSGVLESDAKDGASSERDLRI